jgi:hypothetical protein
MKNPNPFLLIDPTIDLNDQERIAYAQDVFICRTLLDGGSLILCNGPIQEKEGKCTICKAPTREIPHAHKEDVLPFSSSFVGLPDLMQIILRTWPLQDLRLLGGIMRYEPLEVVQDIIHVSQKRHPLGMTHMYQAVKYHIRDIEPDFIRSLAQDVYFVPYQSPFNELRMYEKDSKYAAKIVLGCVAADRHLSPQLRRQLSSVHFEEQWIAFDVEPLLFTEHPEWGVEWIAAWDAYIIRHGEARARRHRALSFSEKAGLPGAARSKLEREMSRYR